MFLNTGDVIGVELLSKLWLDPFRTFEGAEGRLRGLSSFHWGIELGEGGNIVLDECFIVTHVLLL